MGPMNCKDLKLSEVKVMQVVKESPLCVFCKYSYTEDFKEVKILKKLRKDDTIDLLPCYSKQIELPAAKKKDLMDLCNKNLIPRCYREFYEKL